MVNTNRLKGIMAERGVTGAELAKFLGMTPKTFYSKMKRRVFGSDEIERIVEFLKIENPSSVFFDGT